MIVRPQQKGTRKSKALPRVGWRVDEAPLASSLAKKPPTGSQKKKKAPERNLRGHLYFDVIGNRYQSLKPVEDLRVYLSASQLPTELAKKDKKKKTVSAEPGQAQRAGAASRHFRIRSVPKGRNTKKVS